MKNQETLKSQEKIQSIGTNSKMTQMLELSKDIKADIITGLQELRVNNFVINKKKHQQQNRRYKEPNANCKYQTEM